MFRDRFEVMRIVHGRNSWRPLVKGVFRKDSAGTLVEITMRPHRIDGTNEVVDGQEGLELLLSKRIRRRCSA